MQLSKIVTTLGLKLEGDGAPTVLGLTEDSRSVQPGYAFVAIKGLSVDGVEFIPKALEKGAVAIITYVGADVGAVDVPVIYAENPRKTMGEIAALVYGAQPKTIAAVTGTNGKTSVAHFARQLWELCGQKAASIGTLGIIEGFEQPHDKEEASMTTPGVEQLHSSLKALTEKKIQHLAMEVSSHGLDQWRVAGIHPSIAAFTNFTRDHLDYHETEEAYFNAKMRLFEEVMVEGAQVVLNADIPEFDTIKNRCRARAGEIHTYGKKGVDLSILDLHAHQDGQALTLAVHGKTMEVHVPLAGAFQAYNLCCAALMVASSGIELEEVVAAMHDVSAVTGRLELAGRTKQNACVYIDYAHTPDALETVIKTLRPHAMGAARLITLFGCGGDRDAGKRPLMGKVAVQHSDLVVVTDDNPRTEDADAIRAEIMKAATGALEIPNREKAIRNTIAMLEKDDVLLIAGKGHERYQIIGKETHSFDEKAIVKDAISA